MLKYLETASKDRLITSTMNENDDSFATLESIIETGTAIIQNNVQDIRLSSDDVLRLKANL